jgi:3-phytase
VKNAAGLVLLVVLNAPMDADEPLSVEAVLTTAPLFNYEGAPATPDADDPAIWVNRRRPAGSLVIGTAKDAGLLVYDLRGRLRQAILPPNAPQVLPADPPTPAGVNLAPDNPCPDSGSGETFGRFNNVDIAYDVPLGRGHRAPRADVAIVSDRGCDRIRFYRIDPGADGGPLIDITAPDVPRVFPYRYDQPSAVQPSGDREGWRDNPLDDQNTVYGLTVAQDDGLHVFVSQRERGLIRQLRVSAGQSGLLTYERTATLLFDTSFTLRDDQGAEYLWTPCREAVQEEPQSEGLVYDGANDTLYVAFETIGLYRLPLEHIRRGFTRVGASKLIEPIRSFGRPYRATPDDDEFECEYGAEPEPSDVSAPGSGLHAGRFIEADLEGLSIVSSRPGRTLMLASSQGDSTFHFYRIGRHAAEHVGAFLVDGVGETDGVHYVPHPIGPSYPRGLLVVQNGDAPEPEDPGNVNGYEFDGSTQFKYVDMQHALDALER